MNEDHAGNECAANWLLALLLIEDQSCVVNRTVENDGLIIKTTKCCENPDFCIGGILMEQNNSLKPNLSSVAFTAHDSFSDCSSWVIWGQIFQN